MTYHRLFHEAGLEPLSDAAQVQVDAHQAQLPSPLDELVRLHHQPLEETQTSGFKAGEAHSKGIGDEIKGFLFHISFRALKLKQTLAVLQASY